MLVVEKLSYRYPFAQKDALTDISFSLGEGETLLISGPSGCGKSTLLRVLNGLIPFHFHGELRGKVKIAGRAPESLAEVSAQVGSVFQNPDSQFLAMTVESDIAGSLEWRLDSREEILRRTDAAIERLGLKHLRSRSLFGLSSGEKQKTVIASAVAMQPRILVFDEPTANLSPEATEELAALCRELKRDGFTIVIVDHRIYWLEGVPDKILILNEGKIVRRIEGTDGNALTELAADDAELALGLRKVRVPVNPPLRDVPSELPAALCCEKIVFKYPNSEKEIFDGSRDFRIPQGAITAVVGKNGAGKTTFAKIITGLLKLPRKNGGIILKNGVPAKAARLLDDGGFVMQNTDIQLYMRTVLEELVSSSPLPRKDAEREAFELLADIGLSDKRERHPQSLSGGEKQRLVIASVLMKKPSLLVLDEPTSGLDGRNMRIIAAMLRDYAARGNTVLLITHDLEFLSLLATYKIEIN
ncbi:MAG: ABC transporter ATP-binding protein [Opitutales bacterium]|nr:ABC transporter ATP-binding protein [Opitutales bacterium]